MSVSVSRSPKNPRIAYVTVSAEIIDRDATAMVYKDNRGRIGIKFMDEGGEFVVRRCSSRAHKRRINIPKEMVDTVPFGLHNHPVVWVGDLLVIDPKRYTKA